MKPIPPDFQPDERSINNLRKWISLDIREIRDFVKWELPHMITYFLDTKDKKRSWQMTFQRWMRTAWTGKAGRDWEYDRHRRKANVEFTQDGCLVNIKKISIPKQEVRPITGIPFKDLTKITEQSIANFNRQVERFKNS